MIKAIFLDMDDTLIVNQVLYDYAQALLAGYLAHFGVTPDETAAAFRTCDTALFPSYGYSRARMPQAFENTLKHFIPNADEEMISRVRAMAETVFNTIAKSKPDIAEALDLLKSIAPLYIVTAGPKDVQQFRVDNLPFADKFTGIYIVDKKVEQTFTDITKALGLNPKNVIMIGDSLRSDIHPSVAAGLKAVWIEAHNSHHEAVALDLPKGAYKMSSLLETARKLKRDGILDDITPRPPSPKRTKQERLRRKFGQNFGE